MRYRFPLCFAAGLAVASTAQAGCNLATVANIPIHVENGRIFVSGKIDTHRVDFLVDPSSPSILLRSAAVEFGIYPDKMRSLQERAYLGVGPNGENAAIAVDHLPMHIGGVIANFGSSQEVAVLGMDYLANFDVEIDVEHGLMNLYQPTGCESIGLAYWTRNFSSADMVANTSNIINQAPYSKYSYPHINFRVSVNGRELLAAFDPGIAMTALSFAAADPLGVGAGSETAPTPDLLDGYEIRTWLGSFGTIALGRETAGPVKIGLRTLELPIGATTNNTGSLIDRFGQTGENLLHTHPRPEAQDGKDMVIGADFLLAHRVYIAYSQNKIYFTPIAGKPYLGAVPSLAAKTAGTGSP